MGSGINPQYLDYQTLVRASRLFRSDDAVPSILLPDFIEKSLFRDVQKKLKTIPWKKEVQPLLHKYRRAVVSQSLSELFSSDDFLVVLSHVIKRSVQGIRGIDVAAYRFGWKEYTLLHDTAVEEQGFDFLIDFTSHWDAAWGGAVYYADGSGDFTSLPVQENSLVVIQRKEGVQKFVKYVNHKAGDAHRIFVLGTLR